MRKYIFVFLLLLGCASSIPKWYLSPPKDNQNYIYATGSGESKEEAIKEALNFAASKISTQVSSTFFISQNLYSSNGKSVYTKTLSKDITTKVNNINISDFKVVKEKKEDKYYVVIAINRIKNSLLLTQKAKDELNSIKPYLNITDKIKILKLYPKLIKKTDKIINQLYTAQIIFPNDQIPKLLQEAKKVKLTLVKKLNSISFYTPDSDAKNIIQNVLTDLNLPISQNGIKITGTLTSSKNRIGNYYIVSSTLSVNLKDKSQMHFDISCGGKSVIDYQNAMDFSLRDCKEKLKEKLKELLNM